MNQDSFSDREASCSKTSVSSFCWGKKPGGEKSKFNCVAARRDFRKAEATNVSSGTRAPTTTTNLSG